MTDRGEKHPPSSSLVRPSSPRLCLSVDLDPPSAYCRIHSLPLPPKKLDGEMVALFVDRFLELADEVGCPVTFFVVTSTIEGTSSKRPSAERALRAAARRGHELANHTKAHPYGFLSLPKPKMRTEITDAHRTLERISEKPPCGFRAPGYGANPRLLALLQELGYLYDSSLLPSPPYYLAKAAIMAAMRLVGKKSGAVLHDPRTALGPAEPYVPSLEAPHRKAHCRKAPPGANATHPTPKKPLVELPISVAGVARVPVMGTTLALARPWLFDRLGRASARMGLVNLECHGIDLVDSSTNETMRSVAAHQPDLRIDAETKRQRLARFLSNLKATHTPSTLEQATRAMLSPTSPEFNKQ
jgi:peptidoglycan/xylan/chitin deacetylase (PgdA/CDA1 family)